MTIEEIKQALADGVKVFYSSPYFFNGEVFEVKDMGECNMRAVGAHGEVWPPEADLADFPERFFTESEILK
jgi:hypothetical protein